MVSLSTPAHLFGRLSLLLVVITPPTLGAQTAAEPVDVLERVARARRQVAAEPASAERWLDLGRALSEAGAVEQALRAYAEGRAAGVAPLESYLLPTLLLRDAGRLGDALDLVGEGLASHPDAAALWVQQAAMRLERGRPEEALETADAAIARLGATSELLQVRGLALAALPDRRDEARDVLSLALSSATGLVPVGVFVTAADLAAEDGDEDAAIELLREGLESHPELPELHYRLGALLGLAGRSAEAERALAESQRLRQASTDAEGAAREFSATFNRAQELADQNQLDAALETVGKALEQAPQAGRAWALKSKILFSMERPADAIEAIETARELEPAAVEFHYLAGAFLRTVGEYPRAIEALETVTALEPRLGEAHALLGGIALEQQRFEDAASHLQRALDAGLSTGDLHAAYAQVLKVLGRASESAEQWRLSREARARRDRG